MKITEEIALNLLNALELNYLITIRPNIVWTTNLWREKGDKRKEYISLGLNKHLADYTATELRMAFNEDSEAFIRVLRSEKASDFSKVLVQKELIKNIDQEQLFKLVLILQEIHDNAEKKLDTDATLSNHAKDNLINLMVLSLEVVADLTLIANRDSPPTVKINDSLGVQILNVLDSFVTEKHKWSSPSLYLEQYHSAHFSSAKAAHEKLLELQNILKGIGLNTNQKCEIIRSQSDRNKFVLVIDKDVFADLEKNIILKRLITYLTALDITLGKSVMDFANPTSVNRALRCQSLLETLVSTRNTISLSAKL